VGQLDQQVHRAIKVIQVVLQVLLELQAPREIQVILVVLQVLLV